MDIIKVIAEETSLSTISVAKAIKLLDEGNTVPFIARYRREATGGLVDSSLRKIQEKLVYLREVELMQNKIILAIRNRGKMTNDLHETILEAHTLSELEEIYKPYRQKQKTKATRAREAGLQPLALLIYRGALPPEGLAAAAKKFVFPEAGYPHAEKVIEGACDILVEELSEKLEIRKYCYQYVLEKATIRSKEKKKDSKDTYANYADFSAPLKTLPPFRLLAINRGEKQGFLKVNLEYDKDELLDNLAAKFVRKDHPLRDELLFIIKTALNRLILPSIENLVRSHCLDLALTHSIDIFKKNTAALLLYPPLGHKRVMGLDPGFRSGCKWATVDENGIPMDMGVAFLTVGDPKGREKAADRVVKYLQKGKIDYIALGNGTGSREAEETMRKAIEKHQLSVKIAIVSESGASVYSASPIGEEEFPDLMPELRSAISLARRLQDPLNELVKIDPKSIGVGQYQHDVDQKLLGESLANVVQDCVAKVGVNLNNATPTILQYVPGIGPALATNIYEHLKAHGPFKRRQDLLQVERLGPKAFEQAAGFLRIYDGDDPLDTTSIHPEVYPPAHFLLDYCGVDLLHDDELTKRKKIRDFPLPALKTRFPTLTTETFRDILKEVFTTKRDIREAFPTIELNQQVKTIEDLREGMVLQGTIRNIMDFGLFVDINVHVDGLVHISEAAKEYVRNLGRVYSVGDIVKVKVLNIDIQKKRIALSIKKAE